MKPFELICNHPKRNPKDLHLFWLDCPNYNNNMAKISDVDLVHNSIDKIIAKSFPVRISASDNGVLTY